MGKMDLTRREYLRLLGAAAGGLAVARSGWSRPSGSVAANPSAATSGVIKWWDQFQPLAPLERKTFAAWEKSHRKTTVDYTVYDPNHQGQALQVAYNSKQMPDVFTLAGINVPPAQLHKDGWFAPLQFDHASLDRLPKGTLINGVTGFDNKLYSLPLYSPRQYSTLTWYNKELLHKAGHGSPPRSWDEFRKAAKAVQKQGGGSVYGWICDVGFTDRLQVHVEDLAQAAGAPGEGNVGTNGAIDPRTGSYVYDSDPYVNAVEFLVSLQKDGVLFPGSQTLDARTARVRWGAGSACFFWDGSWNIGVVAQSMKTFADQVGVGSIPTPGGGAPVLYGSVGGTFWLSGSSHVQAEASNLLETLTKPQYFVGIAEGMDQPPLDLGAVHKAKVHPTYKQAIALFQSQVKLAPNPAARNPAVLDAVAAMPNVQPPLGAVVQGILSGQVTNVRQALRSFNDKVTAARETGLKNAAAAGSKVSVDDFIFHNWKPGQDYSGT
ncbi:MAG: extracellular solute-binding protein [Candidatus Dormibacteraeota bacterium]|nr:extracellular solute-binding protein [Candidatus Dormibacteraeota bacterium]